MINIKAKGNKHEREVAKLLSEWSGHKFMRTPMSGAIHNFKDFPDVGNKTVTVEGAQVDKSIGLELVFKAIDHHFACTGTHQHKDLIPVVGIGRGGLDAAKMGADVIGQHIVGEIVMGTGKVGIDGDAALAFVSKRIFICHLCLSLRSAVS